MPPRGEAKPLAGSVSSSARGRGGQRAEGPSERATEEEAREAAARAGLLQVSGTGGQGLNRNGGAVGPTQGQDLDATERASRGWLRDSVRDSTSRAFRPSRSVHTLGESVSGVSGLARGRGLSRPRLAPRPLRPTRGKGRRGSATARAAHARSPRRPATGPLPPARCPTVSRSESSPSGGRSRGGQRGSVLPIGRGTPRADGWNRTSCFSTFTFQEAAELWQGVAVCTENMVVKVHHGDAHTAQSQPLKNIKANTGLAAPQRKMKVAVLSVALLFTILLCTLEDAQAFPGTLLEASGGSLLHQGLKLGRVKRAALPLSLRVDDVLQQKHQVPDLPDAEVLVHPSPPLLSAPTSPCFL
ncbi:uncharacterized protein [Patagioenas fasciata]|uniref:uncharacterized protein n=1 Tax=Patagioenas fasciata TaxID=372321 RepID=UPI003A991C1A